MVKPWVKETTFLNFIMVYQIRCCSTLHQYDCLDLYRPQQVCFNFLPFIFYDVFFVSDLDIPILYFLLLLHIIFFIFSLNNNLINQGVGCDATKKFLMAATNLVGIKNSLTKKGGKLLITHVEFFLSSQLQKLLLNFILYWSI